MLIMVGISYGLYFNVIPYYQFLSIRDATDPIPFVHHIVYTPVLAFALYFLLYALFLSNQVNGVYKKMGIGITLMMGINLFLNGGRAGQIVFLVLLVLFVFQYFAGDLKKSLMISLLAVSCIVPSAYFLSSSVNHRVQQAIQEIDHYEDNPNTSAGLRVVMVLNSLKIIEQHPLLGVGTGDYKQEYAKVSQIHSPDATQGEVFTHPHNVYIEEMVNFGVFGLAVLLYMFYAMFALYKRSVSVLKPVLLAFPLFYAVIFLSDGYIMNHYLTIFFLFFAAILYSGKWDGEKKIT
jgi:O-antigen ligase